jgi:hypothetical protein
MGEIPRQLASRLPAGMIRLGEKVIEIRAGRVMLESGEQLTGHAVVVATDAASAAKLVPGLGGVEPGTESTRPSVTMRGVQ